MKAQLRIAIACLTESEANFLVTKMTNLSVSLLKNEETSAIQNQDYDIEIDVSKFIGNYDALMKSLIVEDIAFLTRGYLEKYTQRLAELHRNNANCHIVICGGSVDMLPKYLRARPVGYLPTMDDGRAIQHLWANCIQERKYVKCVLDIATRQGMFALSAEDILYCQSDLKYVNIITESGKAFRKLCKLSDFSVLLPDYFVRIHQSFVVNWHKVNAIDYTAGEVIVSGQIHLPISRPYRNAIVERSGNERRSF